MIGKPHTSPKDVFLHILMMGTLYASVISFITLLFQYINFYFPDPFDYYAPAFSNAARGAMAILIIVFPVFIFLSHLLRKEFQKHPEKIKSRLRKWLLSFTLFIATIVIIVDLVTLIRNFLEGELTIRFLLKNASVLVIISVIFGYYLKQLKKEKEYFTKNEKLFVWAVAFVVLMTIAFGFLMTGSPLTQRLIKSDEQRISHLQMIQSQIVFYFQQKGELPATLSNLEDSISGFTPPQDPETGIFYEYQKQSDTSFILCATFKAESVEYTRVAPPPIHSFDTWDHQAGYACFSRTIDPELYPIREALPMLEKR